MNTLYIAYYVAFGPHGPRTPVSQPGEMFKVFLGTVALVGVAVGLFVSTKSFGMSLSFSCYGSSTDALGRSSSPTTEDEDQRVGRGDQRTRT